VNIKKQRTCSLCKEEKEIIVNHPFQDDSIMPDPFNIHLVCLDCRRKLIRRDRIVAVFFWVIVALLITGLLIIPKWIWG